MWNIYKRKGFLDSPDVHQVSLGMTIVFGSLFKFMSDQIKKYFIRTFGCQMNVSDSEAIAGWYEEKGWEQAKSINEADEVIINSCSVRESAENRVFGLVNNLTKLKTKNLELNKTKIILTGCMLRYSSKWLKEKMPNVEEFKKISEFHVSSSKFSVRNSQTSAFVPIMNGCNNFCSYCVVPSARGREMSRPFKEIICEVKERAERGCKEIMLLGQNVNSYGKDAKFQSFKVAKKSRVETLELCDFASLLIRLHKIKGIEKISFLTSNPRDLDDDIIEAMTLPKIDRFLHLPVQSGDDEILKKMNRKYTTGDFLKLIEKIKKRIPEIEFGTDIIIGFPGETEQQFNNTVELCKKVGFKKAYVNIYSPRQGTAAFKLKEEIPFSEKRKRWKILDDLINK